MKEEAYEIIPLQWDTDEFKVKSCKVILKDTITNADLNKLKQAILENNYEFVTIFNEHNNEHNNYILSTLNNIALADVNIQLEKSVQDVFEESNIIIENNVKFDNQIIQIAKETFIYSRFFADSRLPKNKYDIYANWAKNSFMKEDKYFSICKVEEKTVGFIIFSIDKEHNVIVIELVATDAKLKNQGIGTKLIRKLEQFSFKNDIKRLVLGTQINNIGAQNFYIKNGFRPKGITSVYHWWNKN